MRVSAWYSPGKFRYISLIYVLVLEINQRAISACGPSISLNAVPNFARGRGHMRPARASRTSRPDESLQVFRLT